MRVLTLGAPVLRARARVPRRASSTSVAVPLKVAVPTGGLAGALGSLCGIGGGVVIIPALSSTTAMAPKAVSAASLFCVSVASMTGAASYLEQGFTNVPIALTLMSTSIPGAALGARLIHLIPGSVLKRLSGGVMLAAAPMIWMSADAQCADRAELEATLRCLSERNRVRPEMLSACTPDSVLAFVGQHADFFALGFVTGLASGLIGIGGGLVMNSYMGSCSTMPQHEIVATSLAVAVPIGISGSLVHYSAGNIHMRSCGAIALSAFCAMGFTSRFLDQIEDSHLKRIFSVVLAGSALNMLR